MSSSWSIFMREIGKQDSEEPQMEMSKSQTMTAESAKFDAEESEISSMLTNAEAPHVSGSTIRINRAQEFIERGSFENQHALTREQRALCRILRSRGVAKAALCKTFGVSEFTMGEALDVSERNEDDFASDDEHASQDTVAKYMAALENTDLRGRVPKLDRSQRAICRFLGNRVGRSQALLADQFDVRDLTITNVLNNKSAIPDDVENDYRFIPAQLKAKYPHLFPDTESSGALARNAMVEETSGTPSLRHVDDTTSSTATSVSSRFKRTYAKTSQIEEINNINQPRKKVKLPDAPTTEDISTRTKSQEREADGSFERDDIEVNRPQRQNSKTTDKANSSSASSLHVDLSTLRAILSQTSTSKKKTRVPDNGSRDLDLEVWLAKLSPPLQEFYPVLVKLGIDHSSCLHKLSRLSRDERDGFWGPSLAKHDIWRIQIALFENAIEEEEDLPQDEPPASHDGTLSLEDWLATFTPSLGHFAIILKKHGVSSPFHLYGLAKMDQNHQSLFWAPLEQSNDITRLQRFLFSHAAAELELAIADNIDRNDPIVTFLTSCIPSLIHLRPVLAELGIKDMCYLKSFKTFSSKVLQELWRSCLRDHQVSRVDLILLLISLDADPAPFLLPFN